MAPIKKRLSDLDVMSPSSTKRAKIFSGVYAYTELVHKRETLLLDSPALERRAQSLSLVFPRKDTSLQLSNGLSYRPAIVQPPFGVGPNIIPPESIIARETLSGHATADINPRRDTSSDVCISPSKPSEVKSLSSSPLDLLPSVSSYVSGSSCTPSTTTHGKGLMRYSNGCRYVGFFLNEKRHGYGKCWYPNGCVYSGQWKEGKRHGVGEMSYANGDRYNGGWKEDKRHGSGVYHWKDGRADVCRFYEQEIVGEGYRWSADRKFACRLIDGEMEEKENLTLEDWRMIAKSFFGCVPSRE
ncbi:hypothetical protein ACHAW6_007554 [Cyclotella cf. meneghiniana]